MTQKINLPRNNFSCDLRVAGPYSVGGAGERHVEAKRSSAQGARLREVCHLSVIIIYCTLIFQNSNAIIFYLLF